MRALFMGTPGIAATVLEALAEKHEVVGVFTRPDAVRGRGKKLVPSPVKSRAVELGLKTFERSSLKDEETLACVKELAPDVICVVAYGAILPADMLEIPRFGCLNVHTSLLPRWRGAAPIQRAILAGDDVTGVSIMRMEAGLDTGPYCAQAELASRGRYLSELEEGLSNKGAELLLGALDALEAGSITWIEQPQDGVTYAQKIQKFEFMLDPADSVEANLARVRASSDAHPARASIMGRPLTVIRARVADDDAAREACGGLAQGSVVFKMKRLLAVCADGAIEFEEVKPDGKKLMPAKAFAAGLQGIKDKVIAWGRA